MEFPAHPETAGLRNDYRPRWLVTFPGEAEVQVVDGVGSICSFLRLGLYRDPDFARASPGPAIPQADAVAAAATSLAAAMDTQELLFRDAVENQTSGDRSGHTWIVRWTRQFGGIPYAKQGPCVILDAESGVVRALSTNLRTPPPQQAVYAVAREEAARVATNRLATAGVVGATLATPEKQIVQPNTFWEPGGKESEWVGAPRGAWTCRATQGERIWEVWVDSETGAVIGGSTAAPAGRFRVSRRKPLRLAAAGRPARPSGPSRSRKGGPDTRDAAFPHTVRVLKALRLAEGKFRKKHGRYGTLRELEAEGLSPVGEGSVDTATGYRYVSEASRYRFRIRAIPPSKGRTGLPAYAIDQTGAITPPPKRLVDIKGPPSPTRDHTPGRMPGGGPTRGSP